MPRPAIYLDECVDQYLASRLQQRGFAVAIPQQAGLLGASDPMQLAFAARNDLLILTYNRRHFQSLHRQYQTEERPHSGILIASSRPIDQLEVRAAMALDWIAALPDYRSRLF